MKKILESINVTKLDIINAESSQSFKAAVGKDIPVKGVALIEEPDRETGEAKRYAYIFAESGEVFGGNSATVYRSAENLIELMQDDDKKHYAFTVVSAPTASGREFLSLRIKEAKSK